MNAGAWLASPLAGTAAVLAGLGLLAIPLRNLTSAEPVAMAPAAPAARASGKSPAVLRLRLLAPAQRVTLQTAAGTILLDLRNPPAGESEHAAAIPFEGDGLDLTLQADFGEAGPETAVFLTVMPDGYEDQTRYAIGTGRLEETLRYEWHPH